MTIKTEATQFNESHEKAPEIQRKPKELYSEAFNKAMKKMFFKLSKDYPPFRTKSKIDYNIEPESKNLLARNVGKKENASFDDRFFVYTKKVEEIEKDNEKYDSIYYSKRAVVRVKKPVNNTIDSLADSPSSFYQIWGLPPRDQDIIVQKNDYGIGITAAYAIGNIGGFAGRFEYNFFKGIGNIVDEYFSVPPINSLKVFAEIGFDNRKYGDTTTLISTEADYSFLRLNFGVSKDFHFMRNFSFAPFLSYGAEIATLSPEEEWGWDYEKVRISVSSFELGSRFSANLFVHWLQAVGSVHYNLPVTKVTTQDENENELQWYDDNGNTFSPKYTDFFPNRKGLFFDLGIRCQF